MGGLGSVPPFFGVHVCFVSVLGLLGHFFCFIGFIFVCGFFFLHLGGRRVPVNMYIDSWLCHLE